MPERKIKVEAKQGEGLEATAEQAGDPLEVVLVPADPEVASGAVLVPTLGQMDVMLAQSNDCESLVGLEKALDALKTFAKRQESMKVQLMELAVGHLRARRKLGLLLLQTVHRGGSRSKSPTATLIDGALPPGVDKHASRRCRRVAAIPEEAFEGYLASCLGRRRPPSYGGALRLALAGEPRKAKPRSRKGPEARGAIPPIILDIVVRVFGEVDVLVGDGDVPCAKRCKAGVLRPNDLRGCVLVTDCPDPATWLPKLSALRRSASIEQVAVVLSPETSADWFMQAAVDDWVFGFVPGGEALPMVAFQGRCEGFRAALGLAGGVAMRL